MLVMEGEKLPEDGGEEGEKAAVTENLATVLGDQHQVWAVDGQGLRQRHLARPFSLCKLLFFVLTLVVLVADETVPQKLFVRRAFVFRLAIFFK